MNTAAGPIAATTSLSILLHGVAVAVLLAVFNQTSPDSAVGQSLQIELVSAETITEQRETNAPPVMAEQVVKLEKAKDVSPVKQPQKNIEQNHHEDQKTFLPVLATLSAEEAIAIARPTADYLVPQQTEQLLQQRFEKNTQAAVMQATTASQQHHSILELLHSSISSNKEYPYLARRQRREGTSTVAFVLYPDGSIENTHLIQSSQTVSLDRAAISAVEEIEPFKAAQDYLEQAEEFQVDVVFNLL